MGFAITLVDLHFLEIPNLLVCGRILIVAWTMGRLKDGYISCGDVYLHVKTALQRQSTPSLRHKTNHPKRL